MTDRLKLLVVVAATILRRAGLTYRAIDRALFGRDPNGTRSLRLLKGR